MAVEIPAQLQEWTMEKAMARNHQADSGASSPSSNYYESEDGIRISTESSNVQDGKGEKQIFTHKRYLSSEEALSPTEPDLEEDVGSYDEGSDSTYDELDDDFEIAEGICIDSLRVIKDLDYAICVKIVPVGNPKVIEVPSPTSSLFNSPAIEQTPPTTVSSHAVPSRVSSLAFDNASDLQHRKPVPKRTPEKRLSTTSITTYTSPLGSPKHRTDTRQTIAIPSSAKDSLAILSADPGPRPASFHNTIGTAAFLSQDPYPSESHLSDPPERQAPPAPNSLRKSHSRFKSIGRSISITRLVTPTKRPPIPDTPRLHHSYGSVGKLVRTDSISSLATDSSPGPARPSAFSTAPLADNNVPLITPPRRKMVARGAAERMPAAMLPPFPGCDGDDEAELDLSGARKKLKQRGNFGLV